MIKKLPDVFFTHLKKINFEANVHNVGRKSVFLRNSELNNSCTQIAYGEFRKGEYCEEHDHPTMFEYFYFLEGEGSFRINGKIYALSPGAFVEIPPGIKHSLHADKNLNLTFIYWGIATDH